MAGMTQPPEVTDNTAQPRFELRVGDALAELIYRRRADRLILVHTEVPDELGGRGIGGQLVQAALAKAAAEDLTVVPLCPFARSWLERHRDAANGIRIDWEPVTS
jgi:predicted GNAT family acetyltransferase